MITNNTLSQYDMQGDNWVAKNPIQNFKDTDSYFKIRPDAWVNNTAGVKADEWNANITYSYQHHQREKMFNSKSDVARVIKDIKNRPTHFFNDISKSENKIIGNFDKNGVWQEIAVNANDGYIPHTMRGGDKRFEILKYRNSKALGANNIDKQQVGASNPNTLPNQTSSGAKAHSVADEIIPNQNLNNNMRSGFITPNLAKDIVSGGIGSGVGASVDDENRIRGAILGGMGGIAGRYALPKAVSKIKSANDLRVLRNRQSTIHNLQGQEKDLARLNLEQELNIKPIAEFGKNYTEYYHNPQGAVNKLLQEQNGQVAGAFYRDDLGDIDLVWGNTSIDNLGEAKGYGLSKILAKHLNDFDEFGGVTNGLDEIVRNGKLISENGINTIIYANKSGNYRIGLSQGWNNQGKNNWVITGYKVSKSQGSDFLPSSQISKSDGTNLHSNDLDDAIIPQNNNIGNMKRGFATRQLATEILRSGVGAGVGGAVAPEDERLAGMVAGAMLFAGVPHTGDIVHSSVGMFKKVKHLVTKPKAIDEFKAYNGDKGSGLVEVANKFLINEAGKTWADISNNGFLGKIKAPLKLNFTNTLDSGFEAIRDETMGELSKITNQYKKLGIVLNQLSKEDNLAFYRFLTDEGSIEALSPSIRNFANDVKKQIIDEFNYQVKQGFIKQDTADEFGGVVNRLDEIVSKDRLVSEKDISIS